NVNAITTNLKNNNEHLSSIIQNFHQISDTLAQANISNTIQNTDQAMAHLSSILQKIDNGQGSMGLLLHDDSLYLELDKSANDLNELLEDIKKNPKRYVKFSLF
ncbi:MAG: ABC transporter permease, partial [Bacteroidia bacterium]